MYHIFYKDVANCDPVWHLFDDFVARQSSLHGRAHGNIYNSIPASLQSVQALNGGLIMDDIPSFVRGEMFNV